MKSTANRGLETSTAALLRTRYLFAMLLVALLSGLGQVVLQFLLRQGESNGRVINMAGRQRMLSQRIARNLLAQSLPAPAGQRAREEGLLSLQDWNRCQATLRLGSIDAGIPAPSIEVHNKLEELDEIFKPMGEAAQLGFTDQSQQSQAAITSYLQSDKLFVERMDAIVKQLESDSRASILRLELVEVALFLSLLLCLVGEAIVIFLPTYRAILATLETLTTANTQQAESNAQLEQALQAKSQFLANMSHELRTPLNGILGTAELISRSSLGERQREQIATITDSGQLLRSIINDVLDFAQLEEGQLEIVRERLELKALVDSIASLYSKQAVQKSLGFKASIEADLPAWFWGDGHRIRQILMNLVSNALKFTSKGEIELKVKRGQLKGGVQTLQFSVSDTGVGIEETSLSHIFERFFQSEYGSSRRFGGIGLGLSIAKLLADRMLGTLSASSQLGTGSTFLFSLPLAPCDPPVTAATEIKATPHRTQPAVAKSTGGSSEGDQSSFEHMAAEFPLKILVAEDNSINQMVIRSQLNSLGYTPVIVDHGGYALEEIREQAFDLLLLDLHMPVVTGFQLLEQLAQEPPEHRPRIIAWSATVVPDEQLQALQLGCDAFLAKPYEISDLVIQLRHTWTEKSRR